MLSLKAEHVSPIYVQWLPEDSSSTRAAFLVRRCDAAPGGTTFGRVECHFCVSAGPTHRPADLAGVKGRRIGTRNLQESNQHRRGHREAPPIVPKVGAGKIQRSGQDIQAALATERRAHFSQSASEPPLLVHDFESCHSRAEFDSPIRGFENPGDVRWEVATE